jgi:hypothetical protein
MYDERRLHVADVLFVQHLREGHAGGLRPVLHMRPHR